MAAKELLPHGGELVRAKVMGQKRASDGMPVRVAHSNPILDTHEYEVIMELLYSQVDADSREFILMKEIVDHRRRLLCGSQRSEEPVDDHKGLEASR
jgi:hypothetical protein